eukprot:6840585-Prymnesium_polylepis.1
MLAVIICTATVGLSTRCSLPAPLPHALAAASRPRAPGCALLAKKAKTKKKPAAKKPAAAAARGFGATKAPTTSAEDELVSQCRKAARLVKDASAPPDPRPWMEMASACANAEEYAEARMILEAGVEQCGGDSQTGQALVGALGQMRRVGSTPEVEVASRAVEWPGRGDETPYSASEHRFRRFSTPSWPSDSRRGSWYPSGAGSVCVSETPVLDPDECAWVIRTADKAAAAAWSVDHANEGNIGVDKIWDKPFPDRLWLREVPGLLEWFEHRLRTRLFPMLQSLYPEAIPHSDCLRCHDAFISRYDAGGMASLEVRTGRLAFWPRTARDS